MKPRIQSPRENGAARCRVRPRRCARSPKARSCSCCPSPCHLPPAGRSCAYSKRRSPAARSVPSVPSCWQGKWKSLPACCPTRRETKNQARNLQPGLVPLYFQPCQHRVKVIDKMENKSLISCWWYLLLDRPRHTWRWKFEACFKDMTRTLRTCTTCLSHRKSRIFRLLSISSERGPRVS